MIRAAPCCSSFLKSMMALFCLSAGLALLPPSLCAQQRSIPEQIEWTWEVRPQHPDPALPNVLLIGDSLTRNMFPEVVKDLDGTANVYLFAASTSVGDPRLTRQIAEFAKMEDVRFRVVHFNNGMHGWKYSEAQFRAGFPAYLHEVEKLVSGRRELIWATITPVLPTASGGATNARIDARNAIALSFVRAAGIRVDHQHALMLKHQDLHQDPVHFNKEGSDMEGDQATAMIQQALKR